MASTMKRDTALFLASAAAAFGIMLFFQSPGTTSAAPVDTAKNESSESATTPPRGPVMPDTPQMHLVPSSISFRQKTILEHGEPAVATWGAIERASNSLARAARKRGLLETPPRLMSDCVADDVSIPEEFLYTVQVVATPDKVTVSSYKLIEGSVDADTSSCIESFFSGEFTVQASPGGHAFLEFEIRLEQKDGHLLLLRELVDKHGRETMVSLSHAEFE